MGRECGVGHRGVNTAFTLIELLVVVGIITILLGLLLASISRTRQAANQVVCMSNLRQWGMAMQLYANQNDGFLARRGQGVGATSLINRPTDWFNALPPMMRLQSYMDMSAAGTIPRPQSMSSVWLCPEATDMPGTYYWSYGMNMGLSVWEADVNNGLPDTISGVGSPAVMVLLADAPGNYCSVIPSKYPGGYNPVPRHNGCVNICFLDDHVAAVPAAYIGVGTGLTTQPDVRWHPPGNPWNTAQ